MEINCCVAAATVVVVVVVVVIVVVVVTLSSPLSVQIFGITSSAALKLQFPSYGFDQQGLIWCVFRL